MTAEYKQTPLAGPTGRLDEARGKALGHRDNEESGWEEGASSALTQLGLSLAPRGSPMSWDGLGGFQCPPRASWAPCGILAGWAGMGCKL